MAGLKRTKSKPARRQARDQLRKEPLGPVKLPFIKHVHELRKRLFFVAVSVMLFGGAAATVRSTLTRVVLKPAGDQQFIYTSVGGGFDFAFRICLYTGIACSIPVIVYQLLRYIEPLVRKDAMSFIGSACVWSGILAFIGIMFGYFVALPPGLHFLLQSFSSNQIKALITIQAYLQFVITYLLGSALLFQLPLLLILTNRIHPLNPKRLFGYERWVILGSFIIGTLLSPSPDVRSQTSMSVPIILMYNASLVIIWWINRHHSLPKRVVAMLQKDAEVQATRLNNFERAHASWSEAVSAAFHQTRANQEPNPPEPVPVVVATPPAVTTFSSRASSRPTQYIQDFRRRSYSPLNHPNAQAQ